jgi:hypothetical protein
MPTSDWIKTRDYISWAGLYDNISLATSLYPFHLLKRTIYETSAPGTLSNVDLDSDKSPFDTGSPLTQYDDEEELDLSLVLSSGPNWNHNVPLPPTLLQVINTSFDFEKPSNSKATFSREDATMRFKMTEELRALAEEAEVPSSFRELEIKVPLLFIITLLSRVSYFYS